MLIAICSALIGIAAGLRYRVVVLLPLIAVGSVAIVMAPPGSGSFAGTAGSVIIFAMMLQFGYLGALFMRQAVGAANPNSLSFPVRPKLR
jgi:hypothetical protein